MTTALQPLSEASETAELRYALVAVRQESLRGSVDLILRGSGLIPVHITSEEAGIEAARDLPVVLGVVDSNVLASAHVHKMRRIRLEPELSALPVILLSTDGTPDIDTMVQLGISHFATAPLTDGDLAARVALILTGGRAARERRSITARLRDNSRSISAGIRATNDPHQMATLVVSGLGETFAADHVRLETFPDERVPELSTAWNRGGEEPGIAPMTQDAAQELCSQLWERGQVLRVEDHNCAVDAGSVTLGEAGAGLRTSVIAPLGHGDRIFGYIRIAGSKGPRNWTSTELSLIQHVSGNLAHGLVQGHLIMAQREVLSRLRELDRAKTDFVATVNHELRTPLTSITGYIELIQDGSGGDLPPEVSQMLEIVGRNANRLNQLISDLLTISRSDAQTTLAAEKIDLGGLLQTVVSALAPAAAANRISLTLAPAGDPLLVDGDLAQLEQVFTNLLANSVKFTRPGGTVEILPDHIRTEGEGPQIQVRVVDNGIGIPESDLPKLFRRFFRASNAAAAAIPGTGLGLAIVQDIVLQHGGELTIDSAESRGTTVTVTLPAHR